ncbi:DNA polymerase epsilon catalytic subunit A [Gracilariopsis chorda]|uniref:DNA polymerase epsilon catalytic subunit A n=1 Tax=Gracilariopsis chorda TaxID=448386 RepID=A0A2V3J6Q6_9FLOR|nr:DNA polymerase epsilon catalytic subunit A [Gracilariopsis chorda]|eukprot:PXF50108.1 DNA polymerase epsilon catalytic subunit A [Gracilariopsis chorda]
MNDAVHCSQRVDHGRCLESKTYIGNYVEAHRTEVYRSVLALFCVIDGTALEILEKFILLNYTLWFAFALNHDKVTNYEEGRDEFVQQLHTLHNKLRPSEKLKGR